jgi:hypothetical protein
VLSKYFDGSMILKNIIILLQDTWLDLCAKSISRSQLWVFHASYETSASIELDIDSTMPIPELLQTCDLSKYKYKFFFILICIHESSKFIDSRSEPYLQVLAVRIVFQSVQSII